jgi:hypothetical protein
MIRHIVMWRVRGDTPAEREAASMLVKRSFEGLRGLIPGMRHLEVGLDYSKVDYACDVVLVTEFDTREALEAYASNAEHLRVRNELGAIRTARFQVDYLAESETNVDRAVEHFHAKA